MLVTQVAISLSEAAAARVFFSSLRSDRIVFVVLFCFSAAELKDGKPDTLRDGLAKDDVHRRTGGIVCAVRRSIFLQECMNKKK